MVAAACAHTVSPAQSRLPPSDKSDGGKFSAEFEEASQKLQDYCECLGVEVNERINIVSMLQEAKSHLSSQLAEFQRTAKVSQQHHSPCDGHGCGST